MSAERDDASDGTALDLSDRVGMAALAVRALLELTVILAVGYWAVLVGPGIWGFVLAAGVLLALLVSWGSLVAPRAQHRLPDPWRLGVELLVFGLGAVALVALEFRLLAAGYGVAVVLDEAVVAARGLR